MALYKYPGHETDQGCTMKGSFYEDPRLSYKALL